MKKFVIATLLAGLALSPATAWDFGLTLSDVSAITHVNASDWTTIQLNQAVFSLSTPMWPNARFQGQLGASFLDTNNNPYAVPNLPDPNVVLDVLSFYFQGTTQFGDQNWGDWEVGRDVRTDLTGWVLNSRVDGASLAWQVGRQRLGFEGYYTGLVATQNSMVQISSADYSDSSNYFSWGGPIVVQFAPQRVLGILSYRWAEIFARQDLNLQALGQWDLRSSNPVHTFYYTAKLSGPLDPLNYALSATVSTLVGPLSTGWSGMANAQLGWNLPELGWNFELTGVYTRRLTNNAGDGFVPVTQKGPSTVLTTLSLWNVADVGLQAGFRPFQRALLGLNIDALFQTTSENQNVNAAGPNGVYQAAVQNLDPNNTQPYLGTEGTVSGSWDLSSEWSVGLTASALAPSSQAFTDQHWIWLAAISATLQI